MSLLSRRRLWALFEALYSQELTADSPRAETPPWIRTTLLPHQAACLSAALQLEKAKKDGLEVDPLPGEPSGGKLFTSHGILADSVGSGKSLTALSLVRMPAPASTYTEFSLRGAAMGDGRDVGLLRQRSQLVQNITGIRLKQTNACLFLIPHPLIGQWESYVASDTTLRTKFIKKRQDACEENFLQTLDDYDAIFVSSTMFSTLRAAHPLYTILWKRVFMDEADSIAISTGSDEINALFYWFITASWMNLVFSGGTYLNLSTSFPPFEETPPSVVERVRALMLSSNHLTLPGVRHMNLARKMCGIMQRDGVYGMSPIHFQSARLIVHASPDFIRDGFRPPAIEYRQILCATPKNIAVLNAFISPEMLERLNAGDVGGALDMLGMTARPEAEIIRGVTETLQRDLENARRTYEYKQALEYSSETLKAKALEACVQKIASIQSRISAIEERIARAGSQTCPICYCDISGTAVVPCCQQIFCFGCIAQSLQRSPACPLCRTAIETIQAIRVVDTSGTQSPEPASAEKRPPSRLSKKDAFLQFVAEHRDARILMFSSYDATFGRMESELTALGCAYATLNGSQARITKLLKDFKDGKYNVLFLNARNMGAGLNIDSASHVVLYHRMNKELENQIVGRAVRLGRTADLSVVHLLHENELGDRLTHV